MSPPSIRAASISALILASLSGAGGITYAAIAWTHEQLITPHGLVVFVATTACVLGIFLGVEGLGRARDREVQLNLTKLLRTLLRLEQLKQGNGKPRAGNDLAEGFVEYLAAREDLNRERD